MVAERRTDDSCSQGPKKDMPEDREFGRIDATAELTQKLDHYLAEVYPYIDVRDSASFHALRDKEIRYASFSVDVDQETLKSVLMTALERASDPNDSAFSPHGQEHGTFQESIDKLLDGVERGEYNLIFQPLSATVSTIRGKEIVRFDRLVLESAPYHRVTYRPQALQTAYESMDKVEDEKTKARRLKQASLENGIPFGVLLALYSGMSIQNIFKLFGEQNFAKNLRDKYGSKIKIPTPNRGDDKRMLVALSEAILVDSPSGLHPNFSADAYTKGLEILVNMGWLKAEDVNQDVYRMVPSTDVAHARAVFFGMTEIAQKSADAKLLDPQRTTHIDRKYKGRAATRLITSFLVIEPNPSL